MAQLVKNAPAMWEAWVQSLDWEDPLQKGKATHFSILTLCDPMDYTIHGILQTRILELFPSPWDLSNPGFGPRSPTLQVDSLPGEPQCMSLYSFTPSLCSVLDFLKYVSPLIIKLLVLNLK